MFSTFRPQLTQRMKAVQAPIIPIVGELVRANPGTISLGQGVVSYGPPPQAAEQVTRFQSDPQNHKYKAVEGIAPLIEALEAKLKAENAITVQPRSRVVVTAGGNMAFMNVVLAITDPGDEIILLTPYYFNHEMAIAMASCRAVLVPTDDNYQPRPDAIRRAITARTRAVVTVSPNNPTGAVYAEAALREINEICRSVGIYHISDEAYENFVYDGARHFSPGSIAASEAYTVSLFSFSKAYGFASWRIGYMVLPEHLFESLKKIQDTILICPPVISQFAALGALAAGSPYCAEKLRAITEVRTLVAAELRTISDICTVPRADGAFYFMLKVRTPRSAMDVVERLVREHRVAVIPGTAFGAPPELPPDEGPVVKPAHCYLRVAYGALQKETAAEGIGRLVKGLKSISK